MLIVIRFTFIVLILATFLLSSCAGFEPTFETPTPGSAPILQITPYWTPTSSSTPVSPTPVTSPAATSPPTPTPFTHTIVQGDMLGGIAFQYGLTVEDLLVANPGIDPALLTIGSTLVVPLAEGEPLIEATPVSLPIQVDEPDCYPTSDGGTFCLMMATNNGEISVENLTAKIGFISSDGESMAEEIAHPLLNVIPAGESLPVLAFFSSSLEPEVEVYGEVISALPLHDDASRYLDAKVEIEGTVVEPGGQQATVQGQVKMPSGSLSPDYVWLAAVAYGENGEVIGVRKWEAPQGDSCPILEMQTQTVETEGTRECLSFDLTVYSLDPQIERVEVFVEAGYLQEPEQGGE